MHWSWFLGNYHDEIVASGKQPLLFLFIGLVASFGFIRTSTRLIRAQVRWWPGNVSAGGVHLHHELFGMLIMLVTGLISFAGDPGRPWREILALLFGIGAGLVLDEFALLLRLKDVYWTTEGRSSIDAVIMTVAIIGILLLHAAPFGIDDVPAGEAYARWLVITVVVVNAGLTLLTALKGKVWLALLSTILTVVGLFGAIRLATPGSPWSRWRYDSAKKQRAAERAAPWVRRKHRIMNLIGGSPSAAPVVSSAAE